MLYLYCFFFFKQKTAYEMRISDWSSDVCSSDLGHVGDARSYGGHDGAEDRTSQGGGVDRLGSLANGCDAACAPLSSGECRAGAGGTGGAAQSSEEHTSELQSLMRISYAVFCLKQKKRTAAQQQNIRIQHR